MLIMDSVGVGPCAPTAGGCPVRSSEPFGFGAGRIVRIDEREGGAESEYCAEWLRMTVVL